MSKKVKLMLLGVVLALIFIAMPGLIAAAAPWQSKVDPWVLESAAA
jgi:ABC-type sulfate transport system permease component